MRRLLFSSVLLLLSATAAFACECPLGTYKEHFRQAKAVFFGEVTLVGKGQLFNPKLARGPLYAITFKVEKRWKGARHKKITVLTDSCASMCCRVEFREGRRYLVYVYKDSFVPSDCSWSGDLDAPWVERQIKELDSFWFRQKARLWPF
jgi:hypothetical protein